jgi:hypothetical protein
MVCSHMLSMYIFVLITSSLVLNTIIIFLVSSLWKEVQFHFSNSQALYLTAVCGLMGWPYVHTYVVTNDGIIVNNEFRKNMSGSGRRPFQFMIQEFALSC